MVSGWVFGSDGFRIRSVLVLCVQCVHRLVADSARAPRYGRDTLWPVFPGDSLMQTHTHTHWVDGGTETHLVYERICDSSGTSSSASQLRAYPHAAERLSAPSPINKISEAAAKSH